MLKQSGLEFSSSQKLNLTDMKAQKLFRSNHPKDYYSQQYQ